MNYKLTIGWLYPELMSTYGDRGNIVVLQKRCEWRGIKTKIKRLDLGFNLNDLKSCDLLFMGGAQDRQQKIVANDFAKEKIKALKDMVESETPGLYICGAYQFLGKYYKEADGTIIPCLDILDLYTVNPGANHPRLIGNIAVELQGVNTCSPSRCNCSYTLIGFENHGGRTYLGKNIKPLGKTLVGFGNNGNDKTEGAFYKNSFGTYLHGPILPKNPLFADSLIRLSLEKKYLPHQKAGGSPTINLSPIDETLENKARSAIAKRLNVKL
ncbi:MAG: cobalamin biosynthesis protein CobQ [Candidatus Levybacteria bacterium]|nr:cobalamin biosynthesis protein CobQ [Candidatus Levybacteria bacterium]